MTPRKLVIPPASPEDTSVLKAGVTGQGNTTARFVELDALRGIAAMIVVLYHSVAFTYQFHKLDSRFNRLIRPFFAGHEAVILFFLLSGFVLSLSAWRGSSMPYKDYLVRRVFRIYVPYLASLALSVVACALLWRPQLAPGYYTWVAPPTLASVLHHVGFLGVYDMKYNGAYWSLVLEMRISIIFPFVCLALRRMEDWMAVVAAIALSSVPVWISLHHPSANADLTRMSWPSTLHYLAFFILGALLARRLSRKPWPAVPPAIRHLILPVSFVLFGYSRFLTKVPSILLMDWPVAIGGFGLIYLAATHHTVKRTLGHFIPRYLGHISYSLYLVHNIVLFVMMTWLYQRISMYALFPLFLVAAIAAADVFNRFVEMPAMRMGRRLTTSKPKLAAV